MSNSFPNSSNPNFNKAPAQPSFEGGGTTSIPSPTSESTAQLAPTSALSWVGLVLALLLAPIGAIISIIAFRSAKEEGRKSTVALIGIILGLIVTTFNIISTIMIYPMLMADVSSLTSV